VSACDGVDLQTRQVAEEHSVLDSVHEPRREKEDRQRLLRQGPDEQLAAKLESDARLRKMGLIDPEQERLAEHRHTDLEELLPKFEVSLEGNVSGMSRRSWASETDRSGLSVSNWPISRPNPLKRTCVGFAGTRT
jgi:hypothetical protein